MTQDRTSGLFLTDAEIIARLGVCEKGGYRAIRELERTKPGRKPFPAKDPLFAGKRYWPAVEQWLNEYYGVRTSADRSAVIAKTWRENFDDDEKAAPRKAARPERAGIGLVRKDA